MYQIGKKDSQYGERERERERGNSAANPYVLDSGIRLDDRVKEDGEERGEANVQQQNRNPIMLTEDTKRGTSKTYCE